LVIPGGFIHDSLDLKATPVDLWPSLHLLNVASSINAHLLSRIPRKRRWEGKAGLDSEFLFVVGASPAGVAIL